MHRADLSLSRWLAPAIRSGDRFVGSLTTSDVAEGEKAEGATSRLLRFEALPE